MNIVFVTNNYHPYSGGVVSSINAFYDELTRQGHAVTIVTLDFGTKVADERHVIRLWCPIKFRYKQNHMAVPLFAQWQMARILGHSNPDVIHVHHPFLLGAVAAQVAKKINKPVVFTYHTLYEKYLHYVPLPARVTEFFVMRKVRDFCKQVNKVVVPSKTVEQHIKHNDRYVPTTVIPSPINTLFFSGKQGTPIPQRTRFQLLTVSRFTKEKNIPFLLSMFAKLSDEYELTLVGYGTELANLQEYAYKKLNLHQERVHFVERPTKEALQAYYMQADLFVYASQTETQGLVMLEAMACGTPVVTLRGPGQLDFVENGVNGYLTDTVQEMIHIIKEIKGNSLLRERLKKGALLTANGYKAQMIVEKLMNVYSQVI